MFIRTVARWMLSSWFIAQGLDASKSPAPHVAASAGLVRKVAKAAGRDLSDKDMTNLVRVQGFALTGAGVALGFGIFPRIAASVLALLTLPTAIVHAPVLRRVAADPDRSDYDTPDKSAERKRLLTALGMTGGALLAAFDREGKPSLAWRVAKARENSAA